MAEKSERRSHPRVDVVLVAMVEIPGVAPIRGRVANLSRSGISVVVDEEIAEGKGVIFNLRLVRGWTESNFLSLPGTVARCTPIGGASEIGGQFDAELEEHAKRLLDTLIRMLSAQFDVSGDAEPAG
jgi:hypothetical protein